MNTRAVNFPLMDSIRAIALLSVIAAHTSFFIAKNGDQALTHVRFDFGVRVFFMISAFLLYRPFARSLMHGWAAPSVKAFAWRRALRILPAYWVILGIAAVASVFAQPGNQNLGGGVPSAGVALLNVVLLQSYTPHSNLTGIPPAWSLSVEIAFYLVLPLAVVAAAHAARRFHALRARAWVLCVPPALLWIMGVAGKLMAHRVFGYSTSQATWAYVFENSFLAKADLFTWGMVAAVAVSFFDFRTISRRQKRLVGVVGWSLLPLADLANQTPLAALGCGLILVWVMANFAGSARPSPAARIFTSPPMAFVGACSYSIYLWHWPVILWLDREGIVTSGAAGVFLNVALVAAITIALSTATYRLVELPAMRRKAPSTTGAIPATVPAAPESPQMALDAAADKAAP